MSDGKRFIQIGVGGFGGVWVKAFAACPRAQVVGLVDINPVAMAEAGKTLNVPAERQFATLAEAMKLDFDAALVCVPPAARPAIYETLARAGKHILTEKPLADSIDAAKNAVKLQQETKVHFVVSQNYRYGGQIQALRQAIWSGDYGRPGACQVDFCLYPRFFGFREQMPYPLIIDMSIHHFDLVRFLLMADPLSVVGKSWNGSWSVMKGHAASSLVFEMSYGIHFSYNSSWTTLRPPEHQTSWNGTWYIECDRGCIVFKGNEITGWKWTLDSEGRPKWGEPTPIPPIEFAGGQGCVLNQFIDQLNGGPVAPTTVADNLRSIAMVFGAVQAFETKSAVDIKAMLA